MRDLNVPGGSLIRIVGISQHLRALGCDVTLIAPRRATALDGLVDFVPLDASLVRGAGSLYYAAFPSLFGWTRWLSSDRQLAELVESQRLDLLHCHQHPAGFRMLRVAPRLTVPVVFEVHGILRLQRDDVRREAPPIVGLPVYLRAEKHLFRRVAAVVVRTESERRYLVDTFRLRPEAVHAVPDGADVDFLGERVPRAILEDARHTHGLEGRRVVLFAGWFKMPSGVIDLLRAFEILARQRPNVSLLLVGDGVLMPQVKRFIAERRPPNVVMTGLVPREQFRIYQQLADVVVTPEIRSLFNELGAPLKLFECLASGKPTVATRITSHQAIVRDGQNGYLVEPEDPEDIARGLSRALDAPDAAEVGRRGRETMINGHSWRRSAQQAVVAYRTVLDAHRNGSA
jgi:glycosyltransferase involved in cell wall biosynthesis